MPRLALRRSTAVAALVVVAAGLTACDGDAPYAPSLPLVSGFRSDGTALQMWAGAPCEQVTEVRYVFRADDGTLVRAVFTSAKPQTLERLVIGRDLPGFAVEEALPEDFAWDAYQALTVTFETREGPRPVTTNLGPLASQTSPHGEDEYYVRGEGWLDEDQIRAGDTKDFLTVCTPDPADS
ncbi:hypothetical protein [Mumia quercus]|uniref:hypothetical protein n=1 Tax=Mumia quercus TaxID=2976125 RepID=UPI0021CFF46F|nr:hypothetical protein [Mumia quercus]